MGETFDPYVEWLGIPTGKPSTYYGLFGVELFESDVGVIGQAADSLRARVRGIRPGAHAVQWQALLDEIAAGRACLLRGESKAAYDAQLRGLPAPRRAAEPARHVAAPPARDPSSPVAAAARRAPADSRLVAAPPLSSSAAPKAAAAVRAAVPEAGQGLAESPSVNAYREALAASAALPPKRRSSHSMLIAVITLAVCGSIAAAGYRYLCRPPRGAVLEPIVGGAAAAGDSQSPAVPGVAPEAQPPQANAPLASAPPAAGAGQADAKAGAETPPNPDQAGPAAPPTPVTDQAAPVDPQKQAARQQALAETVKALVDRDLAAAKKQVRLVTDNAQSDEDRNESVRYENLVDCVDGFWKLVRERVKHLQSTDELEIGKMRAIVVAADGKGLEIRADGKSRRYTFQTMPTPLVMALFQTSSQDPNAKVILASFLLVDRKGNRERAGQLLAEAARAGLDSGALLPDLERLKTLLPAAGGSGAAGANQPAAAATQGPERLKQAELLVKQRFQKEYEAATTPARKADLAKALLAAKPREQDSPAVLEVVVREALRLALAAGNLELVTQAANRMAEVDSEDPVETKLAALEEFAKTARGMEIRRDIFLAATKLWPAANAADHAAQAVRLARLASDAARKSSNVMFMRQAKALVQQAAALSERK